jgi:hypothetical protein
MEMKKGRWSESEVEKLDTLNSLGFDIETMGMLLDRPKTSVYNKLFYMRKQNEITSFNIEDYPKRDPDANQVKMSDLIECDSDPDDEEVSFEFSQMDSIELMLDKVQEDVASELYYMKRYVIASTIASLSTIGALAWITLS